MAKKNKQPSLLKTVSGYFNKEDKRSKKQTTKEVKPSLDNSFLVKSLEKVKDNSSQQLEIVKKTNIVVTQISDNIYNIAAKIGAQLTSLKEVEDSLKEQAKLEQIQKQQNLVASEEASMEAKQELPDKKTEVKEEKTKQDSLFDTLKKGFKLPFKDIIKTVFSGGMSFLKKAGGFLLRGLTLFTNPIGLAVAVIGTIGYGIYKYFTDKEFRSSVDNVFQTAKDFIAEKFGQAKDVFGEYIVNPVVNFLSNIRDKFIDGLIAVINAVPDFGLDKVKEIKSKLVDSVSSFKSKPQAQTKKEEPQQVSQGNDSEGISKRSIVDISKAEQQSIASPSPSVYEKNSNKTEIPKAQDAQPAVLNQLSPLDADLKKYVNLKDSSINLDELDNAVKKRLAGVAFEYYNSTGRKIQINSAFRDPKEQEELFKKYGSPRAAKPGKSKHEVGLAFDINSGDANKLIAMGLFDKYGFHRPIKAETWHVEPTEIKNSVPDNPVNPGQAVLVSNEGKATVPSDGKPISESELKQAVPNSAPPIQSNEAVMAQSVSQQSATSATASASQESSGSTVSNLSSGQQIQSTPTTGESVVAASTSLEASYNSETPSITNIDNSSKSISNSQERPRFKIPSPVANRGSLDKYSYSLA